MGFSEKAGSFTSIPSFPESYPKMAAKIPKQTFPPGPGFFRAGALGPGSLTHAGGPPTLTGSCLVYRIQEWAQNGRDVQKEIFHDCSGHE